MRAPQVKYSEESKLSSRHTAERARQGPKAEASLRGVSGQVRPRSRGASGSALWDLNSLENKSPLTEVISTVSFHCRPAVRFRNERDQGGQKS